MSTKNRQGYAKGDGEWADLYAVSLEDGSAAHVATFQSAALELGDRGVLCLDQAVTTAGTGTLDTVVETSKDGTTGWRSLGAFAQATGVTSERKSFAGCDRFVRLNCTIGGGSPNFTFTVTGEAK